MRRDAEEEEEEGRVRVRAVRALVSLNGGRGDGDDETHSMLSVCLQLLADARRMWTRDAPCQWW